MMTHEQVVVRAASDPEFDFLMLDGYLNCYVNRNTGCVVFSQHPVGFLSPANVAALVRFLIEESNAMPFLAGCQGKKEFDKKLI